MATNSGGQAITIERLILALPGYSDFTMNCYLLSDPAQPALAWVVDPGAEADKIMAALGGRQVAGIILTHHHWDHLGALLEVKEASGALVYASSLEVEAIQDSVTKKAAKNGQKALGPVVDRALQEGDVLEIGSLGLEVFLTPGHSQGGICLYDSVGGQLVTGDTLFKGSCGRVDLPGGNWRDMVVTLGRLAEFPPETRVYPGHEDLTTIARELDAGTL